MTSTKILPGSKRRHYKSSGGTHHTYEVIGIAKHSETEEYMVVYKPLFDGEKTWLGECQLACRPLSMWFDTVEYQGKCITRFVCIDEYRS